MKQVYAQVGEIHQQIGGDCPDGWVVMQGERPSPDHVARNDGSWAITAAVPKSVTMRQARLAMLQFGILDDVEALIANMSGDEGRAARIDWEYALNVRRDWQLIASLVPQMSMTEQQVDELFIAASSIQ